MDELELRHAEAHYAEMPRDGYSGRCEMLLPEDLRGMRVLDLGCRNGKGACKLADRVGPDGFVLGVDPSAACVARAEATAAAACAEGAAWAERLAFARGCFEDLRAAGVEVRNDYRIKDAATLMAMVVSTGHVSLALDHLNVYGSGNLVFLPFENEDMSLCAGPIWKKSKETDVILSFIGFLEQETVDLEKRDFIAQKDLETPTGDRLP